MARCILANLELCSAGDSLHDVAQLLPPCVYPIIIQELCDMISFKADLQLHFKTPGVLVAFDRWTQVHVGPK